MTPRRILWVLLALVVGVGVVLLWPEAPLSPEEQVRRQIVQMSGAARERQVGDVMDAVSESFRSDTGGWDKQTLRSVVTGHLLRGQYLRLFTDVRDLDAVAPTRVEAEVNLYFARSDADQLEQLAAQSVVSAWKIRATFEREEGDWRVTRASHQRLESLELF